MQLKQALDSAYEFFLQNDVPSPRLNAELPHTATGKVMKTKLREIYGTRAPSY